MTLKRNGLAKLRPTLIPFGITHGRASNIFRDLSISSLFRFAQILTALIVLSTSALFAQTTPTVDQGTNPYSALHGGDFDSVVLSNGNLLLHIPLISYPQRGDLHLGFFLAYDNRSVNSTAVVEGATKTVTVWSSIGYGPHILADLPWAGILPAVGSMPAGYEAMTPDGSSHPMATTSDGQLSMDATGFNFNVAANVMIDRKGVRYSGPPASGFATPVEVEDPNGNQFTITPGTGTTPAVATDSMGRSIPYPPGQGTQTTDSGGCTGALATSSASAWTVPSLNGGTEVFKLCYAQVPLSLNMCGGNTLTCEAETSEPMMQSIVLPNGTAWTFAYDGFGDVSEITLPTGGTISYGWGINPQCADFGSSAKCPLQITSRSVNANDGSGAHTWNYAGDTFSASSQASAITVTDPSGNQTIHTFGTFGASGLPNGYETKTVYYLGTQTVLKTVATAYSFTNATFYGNAVLANVVPTTITTTWANGQVTQVQKAYDAGISGYLLGQVLQEQESDYGTGAPGALLRTTVNAYLAPGNSSYLTNNLLDLRSSVQIKNGAGAQVAYTTYGYDGGTLASSGISTQHDSSPADGTLRGNQTSVARWLNTTGGYLTTSSTYFDTGELHTVADPKGNVTTYANSSTYAGAFPTTVTNALNQSTTNTYDFNTGQLSSTTDPNGRVTSYTYDPQTWRKTQATYPDGGQTTFCYSDSSSEGCASGPPYQIIVSKKINSALTSREIIVVDGLGRVAQSQVASDPEGTVYSDTTFDAEGRKGSVSNPYRTKSDPTYGVTSYLYDPLNRTTQVTKPDNSAVTTAYAGNVTTVTDEAGAIRKSTADGLGRLIQVNEPAPSSVPSTSGTGSVTLSGAEQSEQSPAIPATGAVTIAGSERGKLSPGCPNPPPPRYICPRIYDFGTVSVIVNGVTVSYTYGEFDTSTTVAQALVTAVNNAASSSVTASLSGTTINLSAANGNDYTLSASAVGGEPTVFSGSSFSATASGSTLTGGAVLGKTTTYDNGTVTVTIAGSEYSVPYGNGSTAASVTLALAAAINGGTLVTATPSGDAIALGAKMAGSATNYTLSVSSLSSDQFSPPSFAISASGADLTGGTDGTGGGIGNPLVTLYTYDGMNDLTCVEQHGGVTGTGCSSPPADDATSPWRVRRFSYDSLKRMLGSTNPEAGAVTYTYDADSNVATKADARGLTITYSYDKLNRLTGRTYSNGDPAVSYTYDQAVTGFFNIGRRTSMTDSGGSESWNYDSMGRELTETRTTNAIAKGTTYNYNADGSLATLTYPSGLLMTYTYDAAGRPIKATDQNSVTYATGAVYAPQGAISQMQYGSNLVATSIYNDRLQPCWIFATTGAALPVANTTCASTASPAGTIQDLKYNFKLGSGDNGNVVGITNNRDTTRSEAFTYDQLNRILTAQTSSTASTSLAHCMGEQFGYDAWGNLLSIATTSSAYTGCSQDMLAASPAVNNRLTGPAISYDGSGNILGDGNNAYAWNSESEIKSAAAVNYTYDGDGDRVQKSNGKIYWYGAGTKVLDESDLSGNVTSEYIFFKGQRIARRDVASGNLFFYVEDLLGSSRGIVQSGQTAPCYDADFSPFGGERVVTNTCAQNYKFEGKERDAETGNDDFGARYYSPVFGRFLSADWSAIPAAVPYANLTNPQTLNLYAMVSDNPETYADLNGHMAFPGESWTDSASGAQQADQSTTANNQNQDQLAPNSPNEPIRVVTHHKSFWSRIKSWLSGGDSSGGELAVITRMSLGRLRRGWEKLNGRPYPKDPVTGRNLDAHHDPALADGGPDDPANITPMSHADHVEHHTSRGDFIRWGARSRAEEQMDDMINDQWINTEAPTGQDGPADEQMEFDFDDFFFVE